MSGPILISGAGGMLGQDLAAALAGHQLTLLSHADCDVTDERAVLSRISAVRPEVIIHLAAYTKVNDCERRPEQAFQVNAEGTGNVVRAANACRARLVYLSTDYVFDGRKGRPYVESDAVAPVNVYGRSKLEGERQTATLPGTLIVRVGWLFGHGGRNFVEAILAQVRQGSPLRVVNDQVGTPTWTGHLSRAIRDLVDRGATGIVHVPAGGECSWYEFACAIVAESGSQALVEAATTLPGDTPRPAYSVLSGERLGSLGIAPLPHWREGLREYIGHAHRP